MRKITVLIGAAFAVAFISACATRIKSYPSLVDQGILALSTTNPYLGANLFLASELESSSFLRSFVKSKGAPTAIEVLERDLKTPRLLLYYPREREVFAGDLRETDVSRQWIIRGPFAIQRQDFRSLMGLEASTVGEPVFVVGGQTVRFPAPHEVQSARVLRPEVVEIPPTPTPRPAVKKRPKVIVLKKEERKEEPPPPISTIGPLSSDQKALLIAKGFAERADNGDLIHKVNSASETLEGIAKWYTGSAANKQALAQASGISPDEKLSPGAKIRIPAPLASEKRAMPAP